MEPKFLHKLGKHANAKSYILERRRLGKEEAAES
jgi:hypothetical protein